MMRWLRWVVLSGTLLGLGAGAVSWAARRSLPPGWDADLRLTEDTGPAAENAWAGLDSLTTAMVWEQPIQEACRAAFRGEFWHDSLLARGQVALEPVLPELRRLLALPRCECPRVLDHRGESPQFVGMFKLNRLLCARALWQGNQEQPDSALAAFAEAWRYACCFEAGANNLQGWLIGEIMLHDVLRTGWRLLEDESLAPAHCLALSRALAGPEPQATSSARTLRATYTCYARHLDSLERKGQLPYPNHLRTRGPLRPWAARRAFHPKKTCRAWATLTRHALEDLPLPYGQVRLPGAVLESLRHDLPADTLSGLWGPPNVQGRRFLEHRLEETALGLVPRTRAWLNVNLRALRLAGALEARRRAEGAWPRELAQLTSFASLPKDPFSGGPLRWDAERGLLYSDGVDGVDEGGSDALLERPLTTSYPKELQRRDLVFHLHPKSRKGLLPVPDPPAR
jgi:hypothetical protein